MRLCKEFVDLANMLYLLFLDVTVGLSVLFTDENYNAPYEDTSSFATKILQDKIRKNVSDSFKEHFPKINCFSHDQKPISV